MQTRVPTGIYASQAKFSTSLSLLPFPFFTSHPFPSPAIPSPLQSSPFKSRYGVWMSAVNCPSGIQGKCWLQMHLDIFCAHETLVAAILILFVQMKML